MSSGPSVSTAANSEDGKKEQRLLDVMFLCDEWKSSKGGLSTFNREFAINLAETTTGSMKIYCYVSKSDDQDREDAEKHSVNLINAETVPGSRDPLDWLKVPPPKLQHPHVVIGHGRKLGTPACHIVRAAKCKWIQFVHVCCEDLGKYKKTTTARIDTIEENEEKHKMETELCKAADAVVAVGSLLQQKYSRSLLDVKVEIITPGIFGKFSNESKLAVDRSVVKQFNVSMFGRATFEDLSLKGYDIVANAIGPLGKNFELTFVGSSPGEHRKVEQWFLDNTGVSRNQLTIRGYCSDPEELKMMFYQSDLVALPSRTEGFGLVALEAISAGIPILVSGESGIAEALRKVEGGNAVIVELFENADEWARRIREMSEESAEEREAKARRLRENYRGVYSWRAECERFKGMIEKVVKNANAVDELDITIDVEDQKPAESNNQTTTFIMESEKYQISELQKSSAAPDMQGSVSHPNTESLPELREKFFLIAGKNYLETTPPQSREERDEFLNFMQDLRVLIKCARQGSLVITVKCKSLQILEELWREYLSGHLGEVVQNCFVTEKILKELNLEELKLKTTMDVEEYNACKVYFERVALRDALSAQSYSTGTEGEVLLERWKQNTGVAESEKMKSSLPILEVSTTGHEKEGEEPQETMKDQKLNIKVDVEHVKLADHDTCSTPSVSTMEPAEFQKASIASGASRKRRSDTDIEDLQPLEKKILCLIAMNYLHTTPPESRDECNEFQEYLLDMKVHITCVPVGSLVITVKCDSLESLEELWEDYSCGLLDKMVQDCFVTEKILKELNLTELKLKTTMDIEEYNACKLFFEKDALKGVFSPEFHSTSSTIESLQKQEELKKWEQKTKIEMVEMKGTPPSSSMPATGHGKELEEPRGRKGEQKSLFELIFKDRTSSPSVMSIIGPEQGLEEIPKIVKPGERKGTSSPSVMSTTGPEKELEEIPKTVELQERKESFWNNKVMVSRSKISKKGGTQMVQNVPSRLIIPSKALPTPTEVTCSIWHPQILSPPLGRNEALVSSVIELACGSPSGTKKSYKFNEKVKLALSHSASDIKGYELVIKELINEKTNDWRDLETKCAWKLSDVKDEHSKLEEFPDWLFPFVEAEITSFSSFAVVWRLKSFTFQNLSTLSSSFACILSDHPGVRVTFPVSSLPSGKTLALTVKVQEVPRSDYKRKELPVAGPIIHISPSQPVHLLAPARLTIPITLRGDYPKFPDYSAPDVRIFCRSSEEDETEWNEISEQLAENLVVLENGRVTFAVNHFSEYWVWIDWMKLPGVILKNFAVDLCRKLMIKQAGFLAWLCDAGKPTNYLLTLCCFPLHLKGQVRTPLSPAHRVCAQGGGNSLKPLCKEDWMSVSLSEAFTVIQKETLDNFLKFLGDEPFERSIRVSINDLSNLQVELYTVEQYHFKRETLCTLYVIPTFPDQGSSSRNFPFTPQVAMREQKKDQVGPEFSTTFPSPRAPEETVPSICSSEVLKVTILADEWNSLKGGLSTLNRELAIHLAKRPEVRVTILVPHCASGEEEKAAAAEHCITIIEAKKLIACPSLVELFFPPKDLRIDVVIGHGVKLGQQAQIIKESHDCKWVQVVHTAPDELGMHKDYPKAVAQSEEKNQREVSLCEVADLVVPVGPKLNSFYSTHLRSFHKDQDVVEFTPGIMGDLTDVKQSPNENDAFQVLMFGRGDDEDFKLKGYDIAAEAFASPELKNDSYHLTFVGAAPGKQDEFAAKILKHGISKNQLSVREYVKDRNLLKQLFRRMDLVIMPSRTEGFGLTALEALSAGLPVLAGHNSGFSKALRKVEFGELCVVDSDKPEDWSKAIKGVRQKEREKRLNEMQRLRASYGKKYNWAEQCEILVRQMKRKAIGS